LVPAHPGSPGQRAIKWLWLFLCLSVSKISQEHMGKMKFWERWIVQCAEKTLTTLLVTHNTF